MGRDNLVSIVIPAFSPRPDWLHEAVASALEHRDCPVEVVVVDDGSPEPVGDLLAGVDDPRLRVIRTDHGGAAHARNSGVAAAQGSFLRFLDSDDQITPGSTVRLVTLSGGTSIAYGSTVVCDSNMIPRGIKRSTLDGWIAEACLLHEFEATHIAMLFPRWVVDGIGGWDPALLQCEDWDFVLRALETAPLRRDSRAAALYRRHPGSLGSDLAGALYYESLVVDRYFARHPELVGTGLERRARAALLLVRASTKGSPGTSAPDRLRYIARAAALDPARTLKTLGHGSANVGRRVARKLTRARQPHV